MQDTHAMLIVICFAVVIMTDDRTSSEWLIWHWQYGSDPVEPEWGRSISSHSERQRGTTRVCHLLCKLCTVLVYCIDDHFVFIMICIFSRIKVFLILNLESQWRSPCFPYQLPKPFQSREITKDAHMSLCSWNSTERITVFINESNQYSVNCVMALLSEILYP